MVRSNRSPVPKPGACPWSALWLAAALLPLYGCHVEDTPPPPPGSCQSSDDCGFEQICLRGYCDSVGW